MNWLDLVLLFILAAAAYRGLKTGLLLGCVRLGGMVVAYFVAVTYHQAFAAFLEAEWHLTDLLAAWLGQFILSGMSVVWAGGGQVAAPATVILSGTTTLTGTGPGLPTGPSLYPLAQGIIGTVCFFSLFILTERLWYFVGSRLTFFRRWFLFLPLDRLGGLILGATWGFLSGAVLVLLLLHTAEFYRIFKGPENFLGRTLATSALIPYYKRLLRVIATLLPASWQHLVKNGTKVI
ncbi:CvpA family protein [Thermodesulfitimonas sp.]